MIMQMQQLPAGQLQDYSIAGLADHYSSLYYAADEASAAVVAAPSCCVPAHSMPAPGRCKFKGPSTHNFDSPPRTQPTDSCTHNAPQCPSTDILCTHDHTPMHSHNSHAQSCDNSHTLSLHNVDDFTPLGTLGRGNMGTVILVLSRRAPHSPFALKITHSLSSKKQRSHVEREILSSLHHPFLQTLHAHFESGAHSLLLLDFCCGGDLNLLRHRQPEKRFSETAARFYAAEVLEALEQLHKLGIVYRDLKPENILLQGSGHIKLTDFDLSLKLEAGRRVSTHVSANLAGVSAAAAATTQVCSLQQQLEAEAEAHLRLQAGKKSLHCGRFSCLRGCTSRREEGAQGWFGNGNGRGECGLNCLCGTRELKDRRTRKKGAHEWCSRKANKWAVGGGEARKGRKSTESAEGCRACLPCMKSKEESNAEERSVCVVGTDEYVAPEVLKGEEHGFSMDWWSFGVLLYEMIYGYTPFKGATTEETLCNILMKEPEFPGMKTPAKSLIAQLLVKDPAARLGALGAQDIKRHPFFHKLLWESLPHISRPPFIPPPLCLSDLEERYSAKLKAKRDTQNEHKLSNTCKSWLDEVVESLEAAENSSQNSRTSSSAGFISSSADGADCELRRDDDIDTVFSSAEWSSELDVSVHQPPT